MTTYRFGPFELDVGSGELRRHDDPVKLPPQPLKVLAVLVRRGGEVVTRCRDYRIRHSDTIPPGNAIRFRLRQGVGRVSNLVSARGGRHEANPVGILR